MKYLFVRCNRGHYYRGQPICPFDGWSCEGVDLAFQAFAELRADPMSRSIEGLREKGVPQSVLERLVIAEFGSAASAFEALAPERYVLDGREVAAQEAGKDPM
jgi:hypothetical protein